MNSLELVCFHHAGGGSASPAEILCRPEWLELLMPIVRGDLRICQSYRLSDKPPLPCPLHIFGGCNDPLAPLERV